MNKFNLRPLAITLFAGGIWDTVAGIIYLFVIGTDRLIDDPHTHSFYSVFLASFFFCFAYLQFLSSFNIRRYIFVVGCLIIGRVFYVIQLYAYILFVNDFPSTFWFTGIIDAAFVLLYFIFTFHGGLGIKDLFLPVSHSSFMAATSSSTTPPHSVDKVNGSSGGGNRAGL